MGRAQQLILFACAFLMPLPNLRVGGVNLTLFDVAVTLLLVTHIAARERIPSMRLHYAAGAVLIIAGCLSALGARAPADALGAAPAGKEGKCAGIACCVRRRCLCFCNVICLFF